MNISQTAVCGWLAGACFLTGTAGAQLIDGVRGGRLYDNWWRAAGVAEPQGNHPLYPVGGGQAGSATWRCAECHGWDYRGSAGVYASGEHATGIRGVLGSGMSRAEMFDLLKNRHGYQGSGLTDQNFLDLVEFLQQYLVDTGGLIDSSGVFVGSAAEGRFRYTAANGDHRCERCHGDAPEALRQMATTDPWQFLHKVRLGDAGAVMPSWLLVPGQNDHGAAEIGRYAQEGFPAPPYAGDQSCLACHADSPTTGFFEGYRRSPHPWQLYRTGGQAPAPGTWPATPTPPLPTVNGNMVSWAGVEYVIGNYGPAARFVDRGGFVYTGGVSEQTQWSLLAQAWAPYFAGETNRRFDLGPTHTTGYSLAGHQNGLAGVVGTWAQDGVRCEACHGPAGDHVAHSTVLAPPGGKDCASCHARDEQNRMEWKDGFMMAMQEAEELSHSPHDGAMTCVSCHNPHKGAADGGIKADCSSCHPGNTVNRGYRVAGMESVACVDCHMPRMTRSAASTNASSGDVRGHVMRITRAPISASANVRNTTGPGGIGAVRYWNQDNRGRSVVTLDYACLGCHETISRPLTLTQAAAYATGIHTRTPTPACVIDFNGDGMVNPDDLGDYITCYFAEPACPGTDFNQDGMLNPDDLGDFITAYFTGC